jgi:L-ascorbate metabolism protein UlaG (beta-lactamase superfamily)
MDAGPLTLAQDRGTTIESSFAEGSVEFIGNATVIIRYAGFTIVTDPNFLHRGEQAHLGYGIRTTRLTEPSRALEELPPFDLVILSHLHEDHFDRRVARDLPRDTPIVTTPHAARALGRKGFRSTHPLGTWDVKVVRRGPVWLRITSLPGRHAPGLLSFALPPVMGSLLEFGRLEERSAVRLYITGDTVLHPALAQIPERYPDIDLALLHLGGTSLFGVTVTMDGRQGVELLRLVRPKTAIPIHYDDYDRFLSPLSDFRSRAERAGLPIEIVYLDRGQVHRFHVALHA